MGSIVQDVRLLETDESGFTVAWECADGESGLVTVYLDEGVDDESVVYRCANDGRSRAFVREILMRMADCLVLDDAGPREESDLERN